MKKKKKRKKTSQNTLSRGKEKNNLYFLNSINDHLNLFFGYDFFFLGPIFFDLLDFRS